VHAVRQELPVDYFMARGNRLSVDAQAAGKDCFFVVGTGVVPVRNEKGSKVVVFVGRREFGGENFDEVTTAPTLEEAVRMIVVVVVVARQKNACKAEERVNLLHMRLKFEKIRRDHPVPEKTTASQQKCGDNVRVAALGCKHVIKFVGLFFPRKCDAGVRRGGGRAI
jgi:hypothetical protein